MKDESEVQQLVQIEARYEDCYLLRNNSGTLPREDGTPVRFGLGNISKKHNDVSKSSDLIGFKKVLITPEMVGQVIAQFTAIEVKKEDWKPDKKLDKREIAQYNFISLVKSNGGIASFCNSAESIKNILRGE